MLLWYGRKRPWPHASLTDLDYEDLQQRFMQALPAVAVLYGEYRAQLVARAKVYCRPRRPCCGGCPLRESCAYGRGEMRKGGAE